MREKWRPVLAGAVGVCLLFALGAVASPGGEQLPEGVAQQAAVSGDGERTASTESSGGVDPTNLLALHDSTSDLYDPNCISCHRAVLTTPSQDPRVLPFHQAMMPFTPGYNPAHGPSDDVCVQCHRFVELRMDSAGALRKKVNPELCALCHGPSGPGPVYYQQ